MIANQIGRLSCLATAAAVLAGCATSGEPEEPAEPVRWIDTLVEQEPLASDVHELASPEQGVVGEVQVILSRESDTFADIARAYGLGHDELVQANPGVDPWLPGEGTVITLPTQFVLPDAPREGIVLNIAAKRLFYFPPAGEDGRRTVITHPVGIGREGWETPTGSTKVIDKARDPTWYPPASVRREHAEAGDPLPAVVEPGPDNPLGHRVLKLDMPGYLIHGTNQPYGVGMRVSHGCVRLYPENIETLYELVDRGTPVRIVNQPVLYGRRDGEFFFEAHPPLADDQRDPAAMLDALMQSARRESGAFAEEHERRNAVRAAADARGIPIRILYRDDNELARRIRLVANVVEPDPDEPTLAEVAELLDEMVEADAAEPADEPVTR
ncbi:MAG: L,D-transpeptidase family protein [Gammaproteobacteria bacterium]|jgi:L,D-transpeptidase ErfK/SrfK